MVLDDVDDTWTFSEPLQHKFSTGTSGRPRSLADYLPQSRNGSILATSRNKDTAARLMGGYKTIRVIDAMKADEGLQLLRNKLQNMPPQESALDLLSTLDYMPLAISQATAYINKKAHMTANDYLEEFRRSDEHAECLLAFESVDIRRDESASNSIVTTWQMYFNHIRQEKSSAARLLPMMSFFNSHGILENILRQYMKTRVSCGSHGDMSFDQDLDLLQAYSLITTVPETSSCSMHALAQLCTRSWLKLLGNARSQEI